MKLFNKLSLALVAGFAYLLSGCDKTEPYEITIPRAEVHFNAASQTATVESTEDPIVIEVGTTDVANSDRVVTYNITSPTGATPGVEYQGTSSGMVTIPAGEALASFSIIPISAAYPNDQVRDTLLIALTQPSMTPSQFGDTLVLILRGPCTEAVVTPSNIMGSYARTIEQLDAGSPYGPYVTEITTASLTGPTTAQIAVSNIWDTGWGPMPFELDFSDPNNPIVRVIPGQVPGSDAGDLVAALAGQPVFVAPHPVAGDGTYSYCNESFDLVIQLGYGSGTMFPNVYRVKLRR